MDARRARLISRAAVAAVVSVIAGILVPVARAQTPVATVRTVYGGSAACTVARTVSVPIGVPVPVDAGGTADPDLIVHLVAAPPPAGDGAATLSIERLTLTPVRLSATIAYEGVSFGYDACASGAPKSFSARAVSSQGGATLSVDTAGATSSLRVLGSAGSRSVSAEMSPVPSRAAVGVTTAGSSIVGTLSTDIPTKLSVSYRDASSWADVVLDRFPGTARIEASPSLLAYTASAAVARATIDLRRGADRVEVSLSGVPTDVRIERTGITRATVRSGRIGEVTVALTSGALTPPAASGDHLAVRKAGNALAARLRLRGLTSADLDWGNPVSVAVSHAGGPFAVAADLDGLTVAASIRDLPSRAAVSASRDGKAIAYEGSAPIGELNATIRGATPLFGRATRATLLARQIPTKVNLSLGPSGSSFELNANGATIGLVEVLATSGPDQRLSPSDDGVLLRDLDDRWVAFARVTGLRKVTYSEATKTLASFEVPFVGRVTALEHETTASLQTAGGRPLRIDVGRASTSEPDGVATAMLTMTSMPRDISATVVRNVTRYERTGAEVDGTMRIAYDANTRTGGLYFWTDAGSRHSLSASLAPLPASVDICKSPGNACTPTLSPADKGSTSFAASERTRLQVHDCDKPDGGCLRDYTSVDLDLQSLAIGVDERDKGFRIFFDTDNRTLHGRMTKRIGGTVEYDFRFPNVARDLWTQDRDVIVTCGAVRCTGDAKGSMYCPSGTAFDVNTHHWRWGIANFAEEICPG